MKRFTAILTALCISFSVAACGKGGNASSATVQNSTAQNTTENTKPESTTSKTEANAKPQKPEFTHPATEEINESIDELIARQYLNASVNTYFSLDSHTVSYSHTLHSAKTEENRAFRLETHGHMETNGAISTQSKIDETIYFDGSHYYISLYGIDAKIPPEGVENIAPSEEMLRLILPKLPKDGPVPTYNIGADYTNYKVMLGTEYADKVYSDFKTAVLAKIPILTPDTQRLGENFSVTVSSALLELTLDAEGRIMRFETVLSMLYTPEGSEVPIFVADVEISIITQECESAPEAPENAENYIPMNSQSDIPFIILQKATEQTNECGTLSSSEIFYISKKELDGSITPIQATVTKAKAGDAWREQSNSLSVLTGALKDVSDIYYSDGFFYVKSEQGKLKYAASDFESVYGYTGGVYVPLFDEAPAFSSSSYGKSEEQTMATLEFTLDDKKFAEKFGEQIRRAAALVAGERELAEYTAKNNLITFSVDKNGYVIFYNISFDIEINVIINGKKFAFTAEVSDTVSFTPETAIIDTALPEGYENYPEYTPE